MVLQLLSYFVYIFLAVISFELTTFVQLLFI